MITLFTTVTERCNANCTYCNVVHRPDASGAMPVELLDLLFARIDEFLRAHPGEQVEVLWHGGEPLLGGAGFFRAAMAAQRARCGTTEARITHVMQSNLTLLTPPLLALLRQLGVVSIGTSFDPLPGSRGLGKGLDWEGYCRRFFRGVALLDDAVNWGVIYAFTRKAAAAPREVYRRLVNLFPDVPVNLDPVLPGEGVGADEVATPGEYLAFLGAAFEDWWPHRARMPLLQPFQGLVEALVEGKDASDALVFGVCDVAADTICITPNGDLGPCGFVAQRNVAYGNLEHRPLDAVVAGDQRAFEAAFREHIRQSCRACRLDPVCHGQVGSRRRNGNRFLIAEGPWCETRIGFLRDYFEPITGAQHERIATC